MEMWDGDERWRWDERWEMKMRDEMRDGDGRESIVEYGSGEIKVEIINRIVWEFENHFSPSTSILYSEYWWFSELIGYLLFEYPG